MRVRKAHVRILGVVALVGTLVLVGLAVEPSRLLSAEGLRELAGEHRWKAAGAFFVAAVGVKLLFVPFSPISVVGGLVFGGALGGSVSFLALLASSLLAFGLGRGIGRGWVADVVDDAEEGKLRAFERLLREHGLLAVLVFRVVPTLPLSAVNIVLGHTSVRTRDFVVGTILGMAPGCYLLAFVGDEALDPSSPRFIVFAALSVLWVAGGLVLGYVLKRRGGE